MKLLWTKNAKESYAIFKTDASDVAEKIKSILKDIAAHPGKGSGSPTKLEEAYSGLWQRTYAPGQVIIYSFGDETATIVSIGAKEIALLKVLLEPYSKTDEQAVMELMAANRGKGDEPKVVSL